MITDVQSDTKRGGLVDRCSLGEEDMLKDVLFDTWRGGHDDRCTV
jgi:hypothetical protein